jgi:hypothetical protein
MASEMGSSTYIHSFRAWVVFPQSKPQVAVDKGDMPPGATESTLLLTNRLKPIIINSFHVAEGLEQGLESVGRGFPFCL